MEKILDIYITKLCNLRCEYCYVDIGKDTKIFDVDILLQGMNILSFDHIKFFGGEPLIKWQEITKIVSYVRQRKQKMKFTIITNGILLDKEKYDFLHLHNISIVVSSHPNPGIQKLLETFSEFLDIKEIGNITFSFILTPTHIVQNLRDIILAIETGIKDIIILPDSSTLWEGKLYHMLEYCLKKIVVLSVGTQAKIHFAFSNNLVDPRISCKKSIQEILDIVPCNRFKVLGIMGSDFFISLQNALEKVGFFENPYRYFFSCPIGYFLDHHEKNPDLVAQVFMKINILLVTTQKLLDNRRSEVTYLNIKPYGEIRFNLNNQCNLRCDYCYVDFDGSTISLEIVNRIVDYTLQIDSAPLIFSFFGGEAILEFEKLVKIVNYIEGVYAKYDLGCPGFKIATNAILLNTEKLRYLNEKKFEIHITLGGIPRLHDQFRNGSWNRLLGKMQELSLNQQHNTIFLLMIHPQSIASLFDSYIFLKQLGIQYIHMELIYDTAPDFWKDEHQRELARQFQKIWNLDGKKNIFAKNPGQGSDDKVYDISIFGEIEHNSFAFHGSSYDLSFKKSFDILFTRIFS